MHPAALELGGGGNVFMTREHKALKALIRQWYAFADNNKTDFGTAYYWAARQLEELISQKSPKNKKPCMPIALLVLQEQPKNKP